MFYSTDIHHIARSILYQYWHTKPNNTAAIVPAHNASWYPSAFHYHHEEEKEDAHTDEAKIGLPKDVDHHIEQACTQLLHIFQQPHQQSKANDSNGWETIQHDQHLWIKRKKSTLSSSSSSVRCQDMIWESELFVPYSLNDAASCLLSPLSIPTILSNQLQTIQIPVVFSSHNTIQQLIFQKVRFVLFCHNVIVV